MENIVEFTAAYDKRHPDPARDCGIHGVNIRFVLKGSEGAVQFLLYTNWFLPDVQRELDARATDHLGCHPLPADLGYHSPVPRYDGQETLTLKCPYLNGKPCYYDGSTLHADSIFAVLVKEGGEAVWRELERYYADIFNVEARGTLTTEPQR